MSNHRRLPVYLLVDCSESMAGAAIEAVERGIATMLQALQSDPHALETTYLSLITFARDAHQVVPLTEVLRFEPPKLSVRAGTALGGALRLLKLCLDREVVRTTATTRGDYKPLVFLLTDGQPTDDWEPSAKELRRANSPRIANIYAIGCGPDVDNHVLREVTDIVLTMPDTPEAFRKFFVWLSSSVQSESLKLEGGKPIDMPPLPADTLGLAPAFSGSRDPTPRQVFLQARCVRTSQPYLMRFARRPYDGLYEAISAHKIDRIEPGDGDLLPPINSALLDGCPSCPHCENPIAAMCPCGSLFCSRPHEVGPVTCPACRAQLYDGGSSGGFDVRRSRG